MELRPILSAMRRNKVGAILIAVQMAITLAILCNALFIIEQRIASSHRPTGADEANVFVLDNLWVGNPTDLAARLQADLAGIRSVPGVVDAYATNSYPLSDGGSTDGLSLNPDNKDCGNDQGEDECRQVKSNFNAKQVRRVQQLVAALDNCGRRVRHQTFQSVQIATRTNRQFRMHLGKKFTRSNLLPLTDSSPMVVREPERNFQSKYLEEFNKVVRPSRTHRARAHRIFKRKIPSDNPGEEFAQRCVRIGVSRPGQAMRCNKLIVSDLHSAT